MRCAELAAPNEKMLKNLKRANFLARLKIKKLYLRRFPAKKL